MQHITTWLELLGALGVIAGVVVLLLPAVGAGWACVVGGVLLVGLSALIEARRPRPRRVAGSETA